MNRLDKSFYISVATVTPVTAVVVLHLGGWVNLCKMFKHICHTFLVESQNHRITESQNSRGWKGPLWVI